MTDQVFNNLPEIFKNHICTIKRASFDDAKKEFMSESLLKVIKFDKIPNEYSRGRGWKVVPASNDALYIGMNCEWYFIEFKNGDIDKSDIYKKIYDSLIMLLELRIIPNMQFIREHINYILVYNSEKYSKVPSSPNLQDTYNYFLSQADEERKLFDIEKFESYLFRKTHTYDKNLFKTKFVEPMELEESKTAV